MEKLANENIQIPSDKQLNWELLAKYDVVILWEKKLVGHANLG